MGKIIGLIHFLTMSSGAFACKNGDEDTFTKVRTVIKPEENKIYLQANYSVNGKEVSLNHPSIVVFGDEASFSQDSTPLYSPAPSILGY